jgi:hypothetical protein
MVQRDMVQRKGSLRARLVAEAEAAIDRMLTEAEAKEQLSLSDIERLARATGERVTEQLAAGLAETEAKEEDSSNCPECGREMRYKGRKVRNVLTETGEVRLERAYYYCPACRKGVFPPGPTVGSE